MNEICRSLFVIARLVTLKLLPFSMKSASSAINPPLVAFGLRSRLLNLYTVGALRVPAWANFWAAFSLSGGKSYSVFSPASTALSYARISCASASSGNTALMRSRRSASVIRCAIITLPFLKGGWGFYAPPYEGLRRGGTGSCPWLPRVLPYRHFPAGAWGAQSSGCWTHSAPERAWWPQCRYNPSSLPAC